MQPIIKLENITKVFDPGTRHETKAIEDVSLDAKTGRLRFRSSMNGQPAFVGTVTREAIVGTLGGERVRLARHDDRWAAEFKPNRSLAGWCEFWSGVPRCGGVRALCASLTTPP